MDNSIELGYWINKKVLKGWYEYECCLFMLLVSHWGAFEFNPQSMHYQNGHERKPKPFEKNSITKVF